jgi:ectoine hydroxylase-related dioxygenase (phytanoyl-CoA dioxygenase family)
MTLFRFDSQGSTRERVGEMVNWFAALATGDALPADASRKLRERGFVVVPGPVPSDQLPALAEAYDAAVGSAVPEDVGNGRTTTRVQDFVNRGTAFDALYVYPPVLAACCLVIGQPFRLSAMLARTLRPHSPAQDLHVDYERDREGWPMIGFILMVDDFRPDNGATRFVPGSHVSPAVPASMATNLTVPHPGQVLAAGLAGSVIIYNGSVWHGHTANSSDDPRRSIQGAYIRRHAPSGIDLPARMRPETLTRISPLAKYVLAVEPEN